MEAIIPVGLIKDTSLSGEAFRLACYLYSSNDYLSYQDIIIALQPLFADPQEVDQCIEEIIDAGWINRLANSDQGSLVLNGLGYNLSPVKRISNINSAPKKKAAKKRNLSTEMCTILDEKRKELGLEPIDWKIKKEANMRHMKLLRESLTRRIESSKTSYSHDLLISQYESYLKIFCTINDGWYKDKMRPSSLYSCLPSIVDQWKVEKAKQKEQKKQSNHNPYAHHKQDRKVAVEQPVSAGVRGFKTNWK